MSQEPFIQKLTLMSSGTLYALGLVAVALQDPAPSLIAIEEPELNIHPGALEAIADILNIAAQRTQVVVTTHSPDLLGHEMDTAGKPTGGRVGEGGDAHLRIGRSACSGVAAAPHGRGRAAAGGCPGCRSAFIA